MQIIIEQIYAATVLWWSDLDKLPVLSGITATVVASLRMRSQGAIVWSEALLCGVFATIATVCLGFLSVLLAMDIPLEVSSGVGGAIGWYGTQRTAKYIENKLGRGDYSDSDRSKF